ncbi:hypothetical protein JCM10914A_55960 [Paenibacillus sp. JCM 10914]|uniref:hypothetical protein n=1 Tax=Paenibacillus sp. JCM 10914 TaxID=1236974 RepID=UPI0003CC56F2|nr:hypothetical protein [Paenibacillus sp. JCM 10914]GAE09604.1 hypothetical protein JCM10914_5973 [Paenibacillus sp. JCM 10914]
MINWIKYDPSHTDDIEEQYYLILLEHKLGFDMRYAHYDAIQNVFEVETEFGKEVFKTHVTHYAERINLPGEETTE